MSEGSENKKQEEVNTTVTEQQDDSLKNEGSVDSSKDDHIDSKPEGSDEPATSEVETDQSKEEGTTSSQSKDATDAEVNKDLQVEEDKPSAHAQEQVTEPASDNDNSTEAEDNTDPIQEEESKTTEIQDTQPEEINTDLSTVDETASSKETVGSSSTTDSETQLDKNNEGGKEEASSIKSQEIQQQQIDSDESSEDDEHSSDETDAADEHEEEPDFSHNTREELVKAIEQQLKADDVKKAEKLALLMKASFDELETEAKEKAFKKYVDEGGEKDGFEYKSDDLSERFYHAYKQVREKKASFYEKLGQDRNKNYEAKQDVLNRLREFIDSEETQVSINKLKELQTEWRAIGPVPPQHNRTLWANYNALINRFYDNRSIYFELKELDRKKNMEAKLALCEKVESLVDAQDIKKVLRELDELHEEYKHIGPVPKEDQEVLWQRFKAASDKIHERRRAYVDQFKEELNKNLEQKLKLCDEVIKFTEFNSDSIRDWNQKTKEIQDLQKRWDAVGAMPRENAKDVNKKFWSNFKQFFAHKGDFFKRLDAQREDNLAKKEKLVEQAEILKESTDWQKTANDLKRLQREWKDIGPVPEKVRNEVYQRFKKACDTFFERKRDNNKDLESAYEKNLEAKEAICTKIENLAKEGSSDTDQLHELSESFAEIGFVPRNAIKKINQRFDKAVQTFMKEAKELDSQQKDELKLELEVTTIKGTPRADRKLDHKEHALRKKISKLEEDISLWKNNIGFFANSKQADKLKQEYEQKIEDAGVELEHLKSQLDIIENMR